MAGDGSQDKNRGIKTSPRDSLGVVIRKRREALGWTQGQLAEKADAAQATIDRIERGETKHSRALPKIFAALEEAEATAAPPPTEPVDSGQFMPVPNGKFDFPYLVFGSNGMLVLMGFAEPPTGLMASKAKYAVEFTTKMDDAGVEARELYYADPAATVSRNALVVAAERDVPTVMAAAFLARVMDINNDSAVLKRIDNNELATVTNKSHILHRVVSKQTWFDLGLPKPKMV